MINSRRIEDLDPQVAILCRQFIYKCAAAGIDILITSTYRDYPSQAALYAIGRTLPGKKVTNARPGESWHNHRVAFDFVPIINGKCVWDNDLLWDRCGKIAEDLRLEWAGRWRSFPEKAHCQYTGGITLAEFKAGKKLPGSLA